MDDVSVVKTFIFEAAMDQYSPRLNAFFENTVLFRLIFTKIFG